jgi:hypothetical protein
MTIMSAAAEALLTSHRESPAPWRAAVAALRAIGPYALIELILPGGSLVALVLWLYRRYKIAKP